MTLSSRFTSPRNYSGNMGSEGRMRQCKKNRQFLANKSVNGPCLLDNLVITSGYLRSFAVDSHTTVS